MSEATQKGATGDGSPVTDPTLNVKEALAAAVKRIDDIRTVDREHDREISSLRQLLAEKESQRLDAVNSAERSRIDAQFLNTANALALATEKQTAQAASLAAQLIASAEVLRNQAAAAQSTTTAAIRALEQNQFQSGGVNTGVRQQQSDTRQNSAALYGLIGVAIAVATFLLARMNP